MTTDLHLLKDTPSWEWPEGTGKRLSDLLKDSRTSEADLLVAAELAGDSTIINDALADALLTILTSQRSAELRARAAISLGPVLEDADTEGFDEVDEESGVPITEVTYQRIVETLRTLYGDTTVPKQVRRRVLEAAVRSPQEWHQDALRAAYTSDDDAWRLTAVFCMRFVRGFDQEIVRELDSKDPDIHYEAVLAAGAWGIDAAWSHVTKLVKTSATDKTLRLAAIDAVATIRPREASAILSDLSDARDDDIASAAEEAMAMAEALADPSLTEGDEEEEEEE